MKTERRSLVSHKTSADAIKALITSISSFHALADQAVQSWIYGDFLAENWLQLAFGNRGSTASLLCSSKAVRKRAGEILIDHMTTAQLEAPRSRRWYFLTFLDDRAFVNSYRPQVDIPAFKRRVDAVVRSSGLDAVCAMEVQALTNYPGNGCGRTLMLNAHAIGFTDEPFDVDDVQSRMQESQRLQHAWGVPTVRIRQIGIDGMPIAYLAYYLLKAPHIAKYRKWNSAARPPGYRLEDTLMRPDLALRLMEFLTQVTFNEMVWGVRRGSALVKSWRDDLYGWAESYRPSPVRLFAGFDIASVWREARALNGNIRLEPFRFLDRGDEPYDEALSEMIVRSRQHQGRQLPSRVQSAIERLPGFRPLLRGQGSLDDL